LATKVVQWDQIPLPPLGEINKKEKRKIKLQATCKPKKRWVLEKNN
jgi:hypothetical protein